MPPIRYSSTRTSSIPESQACPNRAHIMESGKRPSGAMELETVFTQHFQSCSDICSQSLETRGYLCTAFYHEEDTWLCTTYMYYPDSADANEMALAHETTPTLVPGKGDFYRILCGNADRGTDWYYVLLRVFSIDCVHC